MNPNTREYLLEITNQFEKDIQRFVGEQIRAHIIEEIRQVTLVYLRRVQEWTRISFDPACVGFDVTFVATEEIPAWIRKELCCPNHIEPNAYTRRLFSEIEGNILSA
jgi:hypothetical protein